MEQSTTLIATFYSVAPFMPAALEFGPDRIVLIVNKVDDKVRASIRDIEEHFGKKTQIRTVKMEESEGVYDMAKAMVEIIDEEAKPSVRIVVSVSGGLRNYVHPVLYGCYARSEKIHKIVTNRTKGSGVDELPKLVYDIGTTKHEILKKLDSRGEKSVAQIAKELHRSRGILYQHLRELKQSGYVDDEFNITEAGRLALL